MTGEIVPRDILRRWRRQSRGPIIARASSGTATPIPTPIPTPVQSLFASERTVAVVVVGSVCTVVDVLVVDASVLLSVVVTTGLAFVTVVERVDDDPEDDDVDGDGLGELDDGEDEVEEVEEDTDAD
jgi:hypothetical protein